MYKCALYMNGICDKIKDKNREYFEWHYEYCYEPIIILIEIIFAKNNLEILTKTWILYERVIVNFVWKKKWNKLWIKTRSEMLLTVNTSLAVSMMANQLTKMQQKDIQTPSLEYRKRSTKVQQFMKYLPFRKCFHSQTRKSTTAKTTITLNWKKNYQNENENEKARKILKTVLFIDGESAFGIRNADAFEDFRIIVRIFCVARIPNFWANVSFVRELLNDG